MINLKDKINGNKKYSVLFIILVLALYFLRIINLDQDLQDYGIGYYHPLDEGQYITLALNKYNFNGWIPFVPYENVKFQIPPQLCSNLIQNFITYPFLKLFGNTYFGFRLPTVFMGAVSVILLYCTLLIIGSIMFEDSIYKKIACLFTTFYAFGFYFYLSTRVVEPSIYRLVIIEIIVLLWEQSKIKIEKKLFLMGMISTFSIFFVYFSNTFILLAVFIFAIYIGTRQNSKSKGIKLVLISFSGVVSAFIITWVVYLRIFAESPISMILRAIVGFSGQEHYKISGASASLLCGIWMGLKKYISAYIFYYSPMLLFLLIVSVFLILFNAKLLVDKPLVFLLFTIIGSMLLQTIFSEDYIWRKEVILLPVYIYVIYIATLFFVNDVAKSQNSKLDAICLICALALTLLSVIYHRRNDALTSSVRNDYLIFSECVMITFAVIYLLIDHCIYGNGIKIQSKTISAFFIIYILTYNISYISINSLLTPTFQQRYCLNSMDQLKEQNVNYIVGTWSEGVCCNNNLHAVIMDDENIGEYLLEHQDVVLVNYDMSPEDMNGYFNNYLLKDYSHFNVEKVETFKWNFIGNICGDISYYRVIPT